MRRSGSLLALLSLLSICRAQSPVDLRLPDLHQGPAFGMKCGFAGVDPEPRTQIEALIAYKDTTGIFSWLREGDLVHRVYAAEAVIRLQRKGLAIPAREKALVDTLRRSTEKVWTCSGCSHWSEEVRLVLTPDRSMNNIRE